MDIILVGWLIRSFINLFNQDSLSTDCMPEIESLLYVIWLWLFSQQGIQVAQWSIPVYTYHSHITINKVCQMSTSKFLELYFVSSSCRMTLQWGIINHQEGMFPYPFKLIPLKFSSFIKHFFPEVRPPTQYPGTKPPSGPAAPGDKASFILPFTSFSILGIDYFLSGLFLSSRWWTSPPFQLANVPFTSLLRKELRVQSWKIWRWPAWTKATQSQWVSLRPIPSTLFLGPGRHSMSQYNLHAWHNPSSLSLKGYQYPEQQPQNQTTLLHILVWKSLICWNRLILNKLCFKRNC